MESIIEWQGYEHVYTEHNSDWFWILGIVTVASSILAFYFGNVLFGILILVAGLTLGLLARKKPRVVDVRVTPQGIIVGTLRYPFSSFHSFWIETEHMHGKRLLLHPTSSFLPLSVIMIADEVDHDELAEVLLEFMDEIPLRESAAHRLFDYFGF